MMTRRRSFLLGASFAISVILIVILIKVGNIDLHSTLEQLRNVNRASFAMLIVLTALHIFLSNLKWRKIDASLRRSSDSTPSETASFAFTSAGVALGQILPVQVSMSAARTFGTYFYGSPLKRGTAGTLFEQSFDVLIVAFLAVASAITWLCHGSGVIWTSSAVVMAILALLAVGPSIRIIRRLISYTSRDKAPQNRLLQKLSDLHASGFLDIGLARQLMLLSLARFVIQVLMAGQVVKAVGARIPLWQLAATIPFVTMAFALSITPGGLGVNEISYTVVLHLFGTPIAVGAQWALESRLLVAVSCFFVAGCAMAYFFIARIITRRNPVET
ncbi:MAG TPA: lysylphosphatidylglycerol synthase transmembrane domain-containing protein [Terriglobia bacterium]|nr:lysylphosphatidylglycerol synthase transmembrane domain-containing protein [Terriglobia bacterium]